MATKAKLAELGALIRARRRETGAGLREAAEQSGVSPSTLSRLERATGTSLPDTSTLESICSWLGVPASRFLSPTARSVKGQAPELATPDKVQVYLRADKNLDPDTAESLSTMFRLLYKQMTAKHTGEPPAEGAQS